VKEEQDEGIKKSQTLERSKTPVKSRKTMLSMSSGEGNSRQDF
jgi:hypothetical protein